MKNYYILLPLLLLLSIKSKAQEEKTGKEIILQKEIANDTIYTWRNTEEPPLVIGGVERLKKKIRKRLWITDSDRQSISLLHLTYVFILEKDGHISNSSAIISGFYTCTEETLKKAAMEAIPKSMKWTPGKIDNKPVRTRIVIPLKIIEEKK